MDIMNFINGLAWVIAICGWIIGLVALYLDWESVNGSHAELRMAVKGYRERYLWGRFIISAIIATVWLVTM